MTVRTVHARNTATPPISRPHRIGLVVTFVDKQSGKLVSYDLPMPRQGTRQADSRFLLQRVAGALDEVLSNVSEFADASITVGFIKQARS